MKLPRSYRWLLTGLLTITCTMAIARENHFPPGFPPNFGFPMPPHPHGKPFMPGCQLLPFSNSMMPDLPPPALEQPLFPGLELTETQQDKLFELMHSLVPSLRDKAKIARKAMTDLQQLINSDHYEGSQAQALAQTYAQALADIVMMRTDNELKIRGLLTSEQKQQLDNIHEKLRGEWFDKEKHIMPH